MGRTSVVRARNEQEITEVIGRRRLWRFAPLLGSRQPEIRRARRGSRLRCEAWLPCFCRPRAVGMLGREGASIALRSWACGGGEGRMGLLHAANGPRSGPAQNRDMPARREVAHVTPLRNTSRGRWSLMTRWWCSWCCQVSTPALMPGPHIMCRCGARHGSLMRARWQNTTCCC